VQVRNVQAGGVGLSIGEAGAAREGSPRVLFVHGFTGCKDEFADLVDAFAATGWHAATVDLRGHGESAHPEGEAAYSLAAFVDDVLGAADALGWDRFTLVGHSMGGAVAQRLVLDHPERVERLVLMSTFHGPLDIDPALVGLGVAIVRQGGIPALAAALAARRDSDPEAAAARERIEQARPGYGELAEGKLLACAADMWTAMAPRFPLWPDNLDETAAVAVPTLVVVGDEDKAMLPHCERLAKTIPGARFELLEGVRHSPHLEAPDRTLAALAEFLRLGTPPPADDQGADAGEE
jgi:pimeloyl-ACP methyl ester carboxylesterase